MENANPGQVYLYPEGVFYKAYQKRAWLLCTRVHPFKVSASAARGADADFHSHLPRRRERNSSGFDQP